MNSRTPQRPTMSADNKVLERYLEHVEKNSKRWEKLVFPTLLAFILLASYGFFLINSLASDMRTISTVIGGDVAREIVSVSKDLHLMVEEVTQMRESVADMSSKMDPLQDMGPLLAEIADLDQSVASISETIKGMNTSMGRMDGSIGNMDHAMNGMGRDMGDLSDSFTSPMGMMGNFFPW